MKWRGVFNVQHFNGSGDLLHEEDANNTLMNQGAILIMDIALRGAAPPASWYLGLARNTTAMLPKTSVMSAITSHEPTGESGYARLAVERDNVGWPSLGTGGGGGEAVTKQVIWTAGANWASPIRWLFLTTTLTGTGGQFMSMAQLQADRLLAKDDVLKVTYTLNLQ